MSALSQRRVVRLTNPPIWWSTKGDKMDIEELNVPGKCLILTASVARFEIRYAVGRPDFPWTITWRIIHAWGGSIENSECDRGCRWMNDFELGAAFGLANNVVVGDLPGDPRLIPDVFIQGKAIRLGSHLNIPHPGTGQQGDPNISIRVTPEITEGVRRLLVTTIV